MMTRKLILVVLIILLALFGFSRDGDAKPGAGQAIQKNFNVPAGKTLDIDLKSGGPIRVKGQEKPRVEIAVHFKTS